jgi:hypothetical protein
MMLDIALPESLIPNIQRLAMLALRCFRSVLDSYVERDEAKAADVWNGDKEIDEVQNSLFGSGLHDVRSTQHHLVHSSSVLPEESRAHGRSCDDHRRIGAFHGQGRLVHRRSAQGKRAHPAVLTY